jgi:hypothetical protein
MHVLLHYLDGSGDIYVSVLGIYYNYVVTTLRVY